MAGYWRLMGADGKAHTRGSRRIAAAFCMLLVGLSFVFLGLETHGKAMGIGDAKE